VLGSFVASTTVNCPVFPHCLSSAFVPGSGTRSSYNDSYQSSTASALRCTGHRQYKKHAHITIVIIIIIIIFLGSQQRWL